MKPRRVLRALGNALTGRVGPRLAAAYIRLVHRTTRWQWDGREHLQKVIDDETPVIVAFWHCRLLLMCPVMELSLIPVRTMVSNNRDGEVISRIVQRFGHDTIRGSGRNPKKTKTKGGGSAALSMLRHLLDGGIAAITPDGPRGPRFIAQPGVSQLAAQSGLPVLPFAYSTRWGRTLGSWDRFLVAMPFGRGAYVMGQPIAAPEKDDVSVEAHRLKVEAALTEVMNRADRMVGRDIVP